MKLLGVQSVPIIWVTLYVSICCSWLRQFTFYC